MRKRDPFAPVWWRVIVYSVLTEAILVLGRLRERIVERHPRRRIQERVFDVYSEDRWTCCDCGLAHDSSIGPEEAASCKHVQPTMAAGLKVVGHCWPMRPASYSYRPRWFAKTPSLAKDAAHKRLRQRPGRRNRENPQL